MGGISQEFQKVIINKYMIYDDTFVDSLSKMEVDESLFVTSSEVTQTLTSEVACVGCR